MVHWSCCCVVSTFVVGWFVMWLMVDNSGTVCVWCISLVVYYIRILTLVEHFTRMDSWYCRGVVITVWSVVWSVWAVWLVMIVFSVTILRFRRIGTRIEAILR